VEEFIVGKEFTTYLLEGAMRKVYVGEKVFRKNDFKYQLATFEAVWNDVDSYDYGRADGHDILEGYTRTAFEVLKMDDYAKFDVRQDASGRYYFIDCNANPAFGPIECDCALSHVLKLYDIDFEEVLRRIIINVKKDNNALLA
jgi:D-alanine-D-alanine ligase-like ATP-grasp enzyme